MSALKDQLRSDLTAAIRERDVVRTGSLRMALAAVTTEEVAGRHHRELSDDDVRKILAKEVKKRREASAANGQVGRLDLKATEDAELAILETYLPGQLSDDEMAQIVTAAVRAAGVTGMAQMGAAMKAAQQALAGRAEGSRVATIVRGLLTAER